ncbi:MAG: methyl-accepting chemotaxis protein, partial [Oscillospiraceae bacterium]
HGEQLAANTDAAFEEVAKYAEDILGMVAKIAEASNGQALSISQISQGVDQISSVVQMNSATSEESAAASEELSGQAGVMKLLIDQFELSHTIKFTNNTEATTKSDDEALSFDKY